MNGWLFLLVCYAVACVVFKKTFVPELIVLIRNWRIWGRYQPRQLDLYESSLNRARHADVPALPHFKRAFLDKLWAREKPIEAVAARMDAAAEGFYRQEMENLALERPSQHYLIARAQYRDQALASFNKRENFAANFAVFEDLLSRTMLGVMAILPADAKREVARPLAHVPLIDAIPDFGKRVADVWKPLYTKENEEIGLFEQFIGELYKNHCVASGSQYPNVPQRLLPPWEFRGTSSDVLRAYLRNTPLHGIFEAPIPFSFAEQLGEHGVVIAGSGWGKTQLLQSLILHLLDEPDPPSVIVINSQGKMLKNVQGLKHFAPGRPLSDRLVVIDPEDEKASPAFNPFAMPTDRMSGYSRNVREQLEAGTNETFRYMFSSLSNDLTAKMETAFNYLLSLTLAADRPSFRTFFDILEEKVDKGDWTRSKFAEDIGKLSPTAQGFFQTQYFTPSFTETRQQIGQRIYRVIGRPSFQRMFGALENKLDLFSLMNRGSVILVNTSKPLLGDEGSAFFGRWIVSSVMRAAYERVVIGKPRRAIVIIDEASDFVDQSFEKALAKLRQFQVGFLMAFQSTSQIPILPAVLANTSVKLAGGISAADARTLSADMRATPEFLLSMQKRDGRGSDWATFVRAQTPNAIRLDIPFFAVERADKMNRDEWNAVAARNRERYYTRNSSFATVAITRSQAESGTKVDVPFQGRTYALSIPRGTRDGTKMRLRDALPSGDLVVTVVVIPDPTAPEYHDEPPPDAAEPKADPAFATAVVSEAVARYGGMARVSAKGHVIDVAVPPNTRHGSVIFERDTPAGVVRVAFKVEKPEPPPADEPSEAPRKKTRRGGKKKPDAPKAADGEPPEPSKSW